MSAISPDLLYRRDMSRGCRVVDREQGVVDYLISSENLCGDGLRLRVGRWDTQRFKSNPVAPWSHTYAPVDGYDGRPVGIWRGIKKDRKGEMFGKSGLVGRLQFNGLEHANAFAHSIALHVLDGRLRAVSAGFQAIDPQRFEEGDGDQRVIGWEPKRQVLLEASPCVIGMDPDALSDIERTAAEVFDDARERDRFVAHVRSIAGRPKTNGIPLDKAPEQIRALLGEHAPADVEQDDGWIEDGFRWDDRPYEVRSVDAGEPEASEHETDTAEPNLAEPTDVERLLARVEALEAELASLRAEPKADPDPADATDLSTEDAPTVASEIAALEARLAERDERICERLDELGTDLLAALQVNRSTNEPNPVPVESAPVPSPGADEGRATEAQSTAELIAAFRSAHEKQMEAFEKRLRSLTGHVGRKG